MYSVGTSHVSPHTYCQRFHTTMKDMLRTDQGQEQRFIVVDEFRDVHVLKDTHHDRLFSVGGVPPLLGAQCTQHRQDVTQTEVVVYLYVCIQVCVFILVVVSFSI